MLCVVNPFINPDRVIKSVPRRITVLVHMFLLLVMNLALQSYCRIESAANFGSQMSLCSRSDTPQTRHPCTSNQVRVILHDVSVRIYVVLIQDDMIATESSRRRT